MGRPAGGSRVVVMKACAAASRPCARRSPTTSPTPTSTPRRGSTSGRSPASTARPRTTSRRSRRPSPRSRAPPASCSPPSRCAGQPFGRPGLAAPDVGRIASPSYAAPVAGSDFRLGIDFGTSNTVAVLRWPDGRAKSLLFDGSPLLPSAVYVEADGSILTGRDAVHSARLQPHRFEPYPKRHIEDGTVWLGDREIASVDLIASVLRRVATEALRVAGGVPGAVTVTHPAAWGGQRREALSRATRAAGLPAPQLAAEPVAAASYFVGTVGAHVPVGGCAVVYDFGAGTFDASVVRRTPGGGFEVLVGEGLTDAGGLDVDAAVVAYLGQLLSARAADEWRRLSQPETQQDRRAAWQLWEDVRLAKEMLSRATTTYIQVPLVDESVPLGREQLEQLARPILDRTVTATQIAAGAAGVGQVAAIFLLGGPSRTPLAAPP